MTTTTTEGETAMWHSNRRVLSVFVTSGGGALASIENLGFRALGPGTGQHNLVTVLSDCQANGKRVNVFVNAGNQITSVQSLP